MNVNEVAPTTSFTLPSWSAAEFLDTPFTDGLILRALICRLSNGKWQWTIISLDGERSGEIISIGVEKTVAAARQMAASELDKCIRDPFV